MESADQITTYTLEGALSLLLAAVAYKIYRMRVRSESHCCGERIQITTSNRGNSSTDLQLPNRNSSNTDEAVV